MVMKLNKMVLDKKIEKAKEEIYEDRFLLNGEDVIFDNDAKEEMFVKEDIKEAIGLGAKWAINEFIKYLWHPASEKPKRKAPLLCHRERKFLSFMVDELSDFEDWDTYIYDFDITEWLYLDDLFPKKGGEG